MDREVGGPVRPWRLTHLCLRFGPETGTIPVCQPEGRTVPWTEVPGEGTRWDPEGTFIVPTINPSPDIEISVLLGRTSTKPQWDRPPVPLKVEIDSMSGLGTQWDTSFPWVSPSVRIPFP